MTTKNSLNLSLEKVVLGGIITSMILAYIMGAIFDPKPKSIYTTLAKENVKKKAGVLLAEEILENINRVYKNTVANRFDGVDLNKILKEADFPIPDKTIKTEELKNNEGKIIGNKVYKESGLIIITKIENGKIISTQEVREKNGKFEGESKITYMNGDNETLSYKNGKKDGKSIYNFTNGDKEIYNYVDGVVTGDITYIFADGTKETYKPETQEKKEDNK